MAASPALVGGRRAARERALGLLYEAELKSGSVAEVLSELPLEPHPYSVEIVRGVEQHRAEIDDLIARHAIDWSLERMPVVDLAILRMATFELGWESEVPMSVVISEAVELAKAYSTEDSGGFVNGVLAAISRELRSEEYKLAPRP